MSIDDDSINELISTNFDNIETIDSPDDILKTSVHLQKSLKILGDHFSKDNAAATLSNHETIKYLNDIIDDFERKVDSIKKCLLIYPDTTGELKSLISYILDMNNNIMKIKQILNNKN